jgi:hypothetical protein
MSVTLALFAVAAFLTVVKLVGLPGQAKEAAEGARTSLSVLSDGALSDDLKERRLRELSVRLFGLFGRIVAGTCLALAVPLAALWILDAAGLGSVSATLHVLTRVDFLALTSLIGAAALWTVRRRWQR